ncbi:unnamed protein product [Cuscuta epithymum]|uniref:Uncharacterized protein n=1 Tax=Cuscuta epithymum TaxID=186058 RepID=A0AAV0EU98_9ASTE|nr:unnamed protein product [Cuscuta epithymum]
MHVPVANRIKVVKCAGEGGGRRMQTLQEKASEWSGVSTTEAFAIDETNLFQKLGLDTFVNLSTNFYTRVFDDEEEWFRTIFASSTKEDAIRNQYEFFVQRMGGPPLFSERRSPCLDWPTSSISSDSESCREMVASYATSIKQYCKY